MCVWVCICVCVGVCVCVCVYAGRAGCQGVECSVEPKAEAEAGRVGESEGCWGSHSSPVATCQTMMWLRSVLVAPAGRIMVESRGSSLSPPSSPDRERGGGP